MSLIEQLTQEFTALKAVVTDTSAPMSAARYHELRHRHSQLDRELHENLEGFVDGTDDEAQDNALIAAQRLLEMSSMIALCLAIHGRNLPAEQRVRKSGPNHHTLHVQISGGPFIGKLHLTAMLSKLLSDIAALADHHDRPIAGLGKVELCTVVNTDEQKLFDVIQAKYAEHTSASLVSVASEANSFPFIDRIVVSADSAVPAWHQWTERADATAVANLHEERTINVR